MNIINFCFRLDSVALEQQYAAESLLTSQLQRQQSSKVSLKGGIPTSSAAVSPVEPVATSSSSSSSSSVVYSSTSDTITTINTNTTTSIPATGGRGKKRRRSPLPSSSETQSKLTADPKRSGRMYKKQLQWYAVYECTAIKIKLLLLIFLLSRPKLKNIDRSNVKCCKITVDSVTVNITEYQTPP